MVPIKPLHLESHEATARPRQHTEQQNDSGNKPRTTISGAKRSIVSHLLKPATPPRGTEWGGGRRKGERDGGKAPFMGMERMGDYPGSVLWRASLFTTTLGLHGFVHLYPSTHKHTLTSNHTRKTYLWIHTGLAAAGDLNISQVALKH